MRGPIIVTALAVCVARASCAFIPYRVSSMRTEAAVAVAAPAESPSASEFGLPSWLMDMMHRYVYPRSKA